MTTPLTLRPISAPQHREFIAGRSSASFLQTPGWASVKPEWRAESIGWFRGSELVGAGLVLYRQLPKVRRYLAYLPEGPVIDWSGDDLEAWLAPMVAHLKAQGAFAVRMGPPVVTRRWSAEQVKAGVADDGVRRLGDVPPLERSQDGARVIAQLHELGWRQQSAEGGFSAGQPQFNFQVPLVDDGRRGPQRGRRPRGHEPALAPQHQEGRQVRRRGRARATAPTSRPSTTSTSTRPSATTSPRARCPTSRPCGTPSSPTTPSRIQVWLARHEGDLVAATISIRVGTHAWYSYGASSTEKREVRGSNAVQWAMIRDALAAGAHVYDLRGITETLDSEDPHVGLIQFKVGTGGQAVEYAGEWDLPVNRAIYKAFQLYLARRG